MSYKSMIRLLSVTLVLAASTSAFAACPAGTDERAESIEGKPVCALTRSQFNTTLTLTKDNAYLLEGDVRIGGDNVDKATLTIEPGTTVYGAPGGYLVIMRGSQIIANGTAGSPIVFTSLQRDNQRPGLWGGIVINGNARINNCKDGATVCEGLSEGIKNDPPKFGGNDDADSSGQLTYVRVEYAGFELAKDNELNGITFNGVGNGTLVDYVQVYKNADDGIELFGGAVNLKHIVLTDNDDDGLDWDMGWRGYAQFVMIEVANGTEEVNGIEADNLKSPMTAEPRSNPTLSNVTIVGKNSDNARLFNGILLRRGTGAQFYNTIVTGSFNLACINVDDEETFRNGGSVTAEGVEQTGLKMTNSIVNCSKGNNFDDKASDLFAVSAWFQGQNKTANLVVDPMLTGRLPSESSPAVGAGVPVLVVGPWEFTPVDFIGALSPYADEDWTAGWSLQ